MARSSSTTLCVAVLVAMVATCLATSSDSRLSLNYAAATISYDKVSQPAFEATLRSILFTATDAQVVNGLLAVPYGSVGLTLPTNWTSTPIYQVYNPTTNALLQEITLADYADFTAAAASPSYFILSRANGLSRAYTAAPAASVYGYVDIFKWNTSSSYKQSDVLRSVRFGQYDPARPLYESALQSMLAIGVTEDEKYVFYNYESGNVSDNAALKHARIGILNLATGSIVTEIDIPESAHPFYEFVLTPHGAKFVQVKRGVYTFVFSYYAASLVAAYPATTRNRIMVAQFDSKTGVLTVTGSENLPEKANAFDISKNGKYITVGTPYTGLGQTFATHVASGAVEPTHNFRVYRLTADTGAIALESTSAYEADIAHIEYSPDGDRLAVTSTLNFGVGGIDATAALELYKVRSSGSAFTLLDSKQIAPLGSTAAFTNDNTIFTIGMPSSRFKNLAKWTVA